MGKSIIKNGDFEDNSIYATPWTCPGNCGINSIAKGDQPQHGDLFAYLVAENTLGQITTAKKGEIYNLTYYAYGFSYPTPNVTVGWTVQFGSNSFPDGNSSTVFSNATVQPADWPYWQHTLNASGDGIAITFKTQDNTVFYVDNVAFECISCPAVDHTGAIVGGVIGGIAGVGAAALSAAWLYLRVLRPRREAKKRSAADSASMGHAFASDPSAYSTTAGTPSYAYSSSHGGRYGTPATMNISSSQGHQSSAYGGVPEIQEGAGDLSRPDVYPEFRGREGSVRRQ